MNLRPLLPVLLAFASVPAACKTPSPAATPTAPAASAAPAAKAEGGGDPTASVATWTGGTIRREALDAEVGNKLIQMEVEYLTNRFQTEMQAAEQLMVEKLVEEEAGRRKITTDELLVAEVETKVLAPTEAEIQEMYAALARQLRGAPLDQVRDLVAGQVTQRKQAERFQAWVDELKKTAGAKVVVPFPDMPRMEVSVDDDPSLGAAAAPVTIVQFAEYQCGYCGKANATMKQVLKDYDGKVRMVYRDFPLSFHEQAIPAAIAANCAGVQGKYWEIHDLMMANQQSLSENDLLGYATKAGVEVSAWQSCRLDPAQRAEVMTDFEAGQALGVTGTPAFFVNGIMLSGAMPYELFALIIDQELAR